MEAVQKTEYPDAMRIGIGTKDQARALGEMDCDRIMTIAEFRETLELPVSFLRADAGDVVVLVNAKTLSMPEVKFVVDQGVPIEVAGHDPIMPQTYEERRQLRAMTANVGGEDVPDGRGRPTDARGRAEDHRAIA